ncbi:MAG TPA: hypothetical protein VHC98_03910 [Candidatus Saccharimonadales bacterium]|nr:hypothetical protein [Candidatus Saccharimonadales bacterium]
MQLLRRHTQAEPTIRRRPAPSGRPTAYSYHTYRSAEPAVTGRQLFRDTHIAEKASRTASYWAKRFGLLAIIAALIVSVVNFLILTPDPSVRPLDPTNATFLHSTATYQQAAAKLLSGSVLNRNKLTVDLSGVAAALQHQFPELASVSVSLPLAGHRPIIYITPTKPVLELTTTTRNTYVIDANGRVLSMVTSGSTALALAQVEDQSGTPVTIGQLALPGSTVSFIQSVLYQLKQKQVGVARLVLPAGKSELDLYPSGQPYFVKFNLADATPVQQAGTFLAVRHALMEQGKTPTQYVDVRVGGRAYYQ